MSKSLRTNPGERAHDRHRQHGPVQEIKLQRPPVNALNDELLEALEDAVLAAPCARRARAGDLAVAKRPFPAASTCPT
jgi:enoyl-CoA hydratase/carnithine racemase